MQAKLPVLCFLGGGEVGSFYLGFAGVFDYSLASSHILHLTRRFMNVLEVNILAIQNVICTLIKIRNMLLCTGGIS